MKRAFVIASGFLLCLSLTGCSAFQAARTEQEDGYQPDGTYILSEEERSQNCAALQSWIRGYADSVRKHASRLARTQSKPAGSVLSGLTRLSGERESNSTTHIMCRQYAIMLAMNRELKDRGCNTVDIHATLAFPGGASTAGEGEGPSRTWGVRSGPTQSEYRSASPSVVCGTP